ncbi:hypothetical protein [Natrarchaeobaculum sulfurireducens]|uniref:Iron-sulfur cluster containing transcriptional regulator n=1 Tax=Natrarchaeobaculum sulfurireducens TaxID=2044521 RepID=A0A346PDV9_9EURY|nr:hypothetical protein [Natrarchaeobaculum sulfurireducens]AXR77704.1 Iron-sulfur cluster containing transcriptional regulator [Natrarchaeobaculum sulfurireducens]
MKDVRKLIIEHLEQIGEPQPASRIANAIDYSHGYVLKESKELLKEDYINGEKNRNVPFYEINGEIEVISNNRKQLLILVKKHAPGRLDAAENMTVPELQRLLRSISDGVVGVQKSWEFWT